MEPSVCRVNRHGLISKNQSFLRYSDITILHLMFNLHGQFCTFHGPMPDGHDKRQLYGYEKDHLLKAICDDEPIGN